MGRTADNSSGGFSLIELMIALSIGLVVIAAAVQLFSKGVSAAWTVSQRAQMQQDARAAQDMLVKDISMAGSGIQGGVALASGTARIPRYGCDQNTCYVPGSAAPAGIAFPNNYLYPIMPGAAQGPTLNAAAGPTDIITVTYADTNFLLNCYTVTFNNPPNNTSVNFTLPNPLPPNCVPPQVPQNPQPVTSASVGLQVGDLVLFTGSVGGNTLQAVGEVTNAVGGASPYTVTFADPDRLLLNQTTATGGSMRQLSGPGFQAVRIWVITYYVWVAPDPSGAGPGTPRLMRQVNGLPPVPVADNVSNLRFSYDTYDDNGNLLTRSRDAGLTQIPPVNPNSIRKVTLESLTFRSPLPGVQGYQSLDLHTSVSARNMSFKDRYN